MGVLTTNTPQGDTHNKRAQNASTQTGRHANKVKSQSLELSSDVVIGSNNEDDNTISTTSSINARLVTRPLKPSFAKTKKNMPTAGSVAMVFSGLGGFMDSATNSEETCIDPDLFRMPSPPRNIETASTETADTIPSTSQPSDQTMRDVTGDSNVDNVHH